jgi:hypothetical protein
MSYSGIRVNLAPVPTVLLSVLQQYNYYRVGVLVDLACRNSRDAIVQVSYRYTYRYVNTESRVNIHKRGKGL